MGISPFGTLLAGFSSPDRTAASFCVWIEFCSSAAKLFGGNAVRSSNTGLTSAVSALRPSVPDRNPNLNPHSHSTTNRVEPATTSHSATVTPGLSCDILTPIPASG